MNTTLPYRQLPTTQKALVANGPDTLVLSTDAPTPSLNDDGILVKVAAVGLNPADWKWLTNPAIPKGTIAGLDYAGTVVAVGKNAQASRIKVGDRVFSAHFRPGTGSLDNGAFAEYVAAHPELVVKIPDHLSFEQAASLGVSVGTAGLILYQSLHLSNPKSPSRDAQYVLVYGASTASGLMVLQLLKLSGYIPIAVCSSHNFDLVRSYGAERAFDYHSPTCVADVCRYVDNALEISIDCVAQSESATFCYQCIGSSGGMYTAINPIPDEVPTRQDVIADWVLAYTISGEDVTLPPPFSRKARPEDRVFGMQWFHYFEGLLSRNQIKLPPLQVGFGFWSIKKGLQMLREGKISSEKLVYRIPQFGVDRHDLSQSKISDISAKQRGALNIAGRYRKEPIAIIGSACRFPGSINSPARLWEALTHPSDFSRDLSPTRFRQENFYHVNKEKYGSTYVRKAYLLDDDLGEFDTQFFNISPLEAEAMDPQQRILLEVTYEAVEAAGLSMHSLQGSNTSCFVGVMSTDYHALQSMDLNTMPKYSATGGARSILSNRLSYFFDWKGQSVTIDTACSSSLVAIHHGVQSIRSGESSLAVVAGANLLLSPEGFIAESKLSMLSPDCKSKMWDAAADGYARGEGMAAMILKPLSQAIADGDRIECVIRETGVNQDGRTKGITMPSSEAQARLIRSTYFNAGLDPSNETERCQYFEAHGTGTPAGDPLEAQAIAKAFFSSQTEPSLPHKAGKLYVGSIKTIIGHLEGCAGLAGVLKASLALQNATIPPNLHFSTLNPAIEPYYSRLLVPTKSIAWPDIQEGACRRASVNSFGFGGANSHVILESFAETTSENGWAKSDSNAHSRIIESFHFSSPSETTLCQSLRLFTEWLISHPSANVKDIAWTLRNRRTTWPVRIAVAASTTEQLLTKLSEIIGKIEAETFGLRKAHILKAGKAFSILGVFTGQGAQWPTMGRAFLQQSPVFRNTISRLQIILDSLPDAPQWTLQQELMADASCSKLDRAQFSQPLCTAVQIGLVDMLHYTGLRFQAVVGHSSGEIAAAYAAGFIAAHDAIRIAYYRGICSQFSRGRNGEKGAMMAVGISYEDAVSFCALPQWHNRLQIAASNGPRTVTLSGDRDAIDEAYTYFDENKMFARLLNVDKAYHSYHMQPCAEAYSSALEATEIKIETNNASCRWYSSTREAKVMTFDELSTVNHKYWIDNMVEPVLFSQAVEFAVESEGWFDLAVEMGPHPALQGPCSEVIENLTATKLLYVGLMRRNADDNYSFMDAIGSIWRHFDNSSLQFERMRSLFTQETQRSPKLVSGLPTFPWDHSRSYWKNSRVVHSFLFGNRPDNQLLGRRSPNDTMDVMHWTNMLSTKDVPWLKGHAYQSQVLVPAAAFVSMAFQAAVTMVENRDVSTIEIVDLEIPKGLYLKDDSTIIEVNVYLHVVNTEQLSNGCRRIVANFTCLSSADDDKALLEKNAAGKIILYVGTTEDTNEFPPRSFGYSNKKKADVETFYRGCAHIGLDYTGCFRRMTELSRESDKASASATWLDKDELGSSMLIHPAVLDFAFASMFGAAFSLSDLGLWTPYLPTFIRRIRLNPKYLTQDRSVIRTYEVDTYVVESDSSKLDGDMDLYCQGETEVMIQIEGFRATAMTRRTAADDRHMFAQRIWQLAIENGLERVPTAENIARDQEIITLCERLSAFYYRGLLTQVQREEIVPGQTIDCQRIVEFAQSIASWVGAGDHPTIRREWLHDTETCLDRLKSGFEDHIDVKLITLVGKNLPAIVSGELSALELMVKNQLLAPFYSNGVGLKHANTGMARTIGQISHRYPQMKILEIGGGTASVTEGILDELHEHFSSYTFTDLSPSFFEAAKTKLRRYVTKMTFKTLNIEEAPHDQGFKQYSYDLIVAANVLHATSNIERTLKHVRRLLRPGGYLVMLEITGQLLKVPFIVSTLPGWFSAEEASRRLNPTLSVENWHRTLQANGFSGVDLVLPDYAEVQYHTGSLILTQAIDDVVELIREPLQAPTNIPQPPQILLVGGSTSESNLIISSVKPQLSLWMDEIHHITDLNQLPATMLQTGCFVLLTMDLDKPSFLNITDAEVKAMKQLFECADTILWLTRGCRSLNPDHNMTIGAGRSLRNEYPRVAFEFLDLECQIDSNLGSVIVEHMMRLRMRDAAKQFDLLWSNEPELILSDKGLLFGRVVPDDDLNARLNSSQRPIYQEVRLEETNVAVCENGDQLELLEANTTIGKSSEPSYLEVRMTYSAIEPIATHTGRSIFVCTGITKRDEKPVMFITDQLTSRIETNANVVRYMTIKPGQESHSIVFVKDRIQSSYILYDLLRNETVLMVQPSKSLASITRHLGGCRGVRVICIGMDESCIDLSGWIHVHKKVSSRQLRSLLPQKIHKIVYSNRKSRTKFEPLLSGHLSKSTIVTDTTRVEDQWCLDRKAGYKESFIDLFAECCSLLEAQTEENDNFQTVSVSDLPLPSAVVLAADVLTWCKHSHAKLRVRPAREVTKFAAGRTYLMVGLTADLGRSICRWMISAGATHVVLTSRTPKVEPAWLEEMEKLGGIVKVFQMDVTNEQSLHHACNQIETQMPPIAGVLNGAAWIHDFPFESLDAESINSVIEPKRNGSINLDKYFTTRQLDFFVLFSSFSSVVGNLSQSNYGAANMFMAAFAAQQQAKGLAASVMNAGMIVDVGHVSRVGKGLEEYLKTLGFVAITEPDLHEMFAAAVLVGQPGSSHQPEFSMGIRHFNTDLSPDHRPLIWNKPDFGHWFRDNNESVLGIASDVRGTLRDQLLVADNTAERTDILTKTFSSKMEALLSLPPGGMPEDMPIIETGVDSLFAVEFRSWVLKEISVDLKISDLLGGASVNSICIDVAVNLPLEEWRLESESSA